MQLIDFNCDYYITFYFLKFNFGFIFENKLNLRRD